MSAWRTRRPRKVAANSQRNSGDLKSRQANEIERLKHENEKLREKVAEQATQIAEAEQQITKAEQQIADLERQLALRQQNSTTSAKPPCSARPSAVRKPAARHPATPHASVDSLRRSLLRGFCGGLL